MFNFHDLLVVVAIIERRLLGDILVIVGVIQNFVDVFCAQYTGKLWICPCLLLQHSCITHITSRTKCYIQFTAVHTKLKHCRQSIISFRNQIWWIWKEKGTILHKMQKFDSIQVTTILEVPKTFGFITESSYLVSIYYNEKRENFIVKIFSDSMASPKIKHVKTMCIINDSAVRGRLSENYLIWKFHEIFVTWNIHY